MADVRIAPVVTPAMPRVPAPPRVGGEGPGGFADALGRALVQVNDLQVRAQSAAAALASGQAVSTADTVVAVEKANIAFQFALQIRNKLLESYQDVMRMQV
jgi:flagellar hook-basal body complex protein FliE